MSEYNERKLLRRLQALSRIEPDLESTERATANAKKAIMELKEDAACPKRLFGIGSVRRLLTYTAVAVVLIASGFGVSLVWKSLDGKDIRQVVQQPKAPKDDSAIAAVTLEKTPKDKPPPEELKDASSRIEQELERIIALAGANDVDGLIRILHEGEFASKLLAAGYLMQIGDARAIEPLELLSTEWYGLDKANPFATAIKAIQSRIAKELADAANEKTPPDDDTAIDVQPAPKPKVELTGGGTIKGEVVDAAGKGISGAKVIPLSLAAPTIASAEGTAETVDGAFELKHIGEGLRSIKVAHPDYSAVFQRDIEVRNGYLTGGIIVTMYKGSTVQGYVYDDQGRPQPDVTLHVQDAGVSSPGTEYEKAGRLAMTTTDPNGFYRADGLPAERMCYIKRGDMDKRNGVVCRAVVPADKKIMRLDFGAGPVVSGQVMVDGRFLANSTMLLTDPERSDLDVFKCYTMTDEEGGFAFRGVPVGRHGVYMEQDGQRGAWFGIATIEVDLADVELGIIEIATSTIEVQVQADDPNNVPEDVTVYLQQGHGFTGARVGSMQKPSRQGAPYIIQGVLPGEYTIVSGRFDSVQGRKELTVGPSPETIATAVTIPHGGAGVSGHYIGPSSGMVFLFTNDGEVACYIDPDNAETYRINDLPAGDYLVINDLVGKTVPLLAFNIAEGEHRVVDLDMSGWLAADRGALHTQVISEAGVPVSGVQVWLEGEGVEAEPVRNNSEGQFFVVEPGEYVIHADYPALGRADRRVVVPANDITQPRRAETTIILRLTR